MTRRNPERAAWVILWAAFLTFCGLAYFIPAGLQWALENTASDQKISLTGSNTVYIQRPGRTSPEVNVVDIPVGAIISTQTNAQATLTFVSPDKGETIASVQIYGSTQLLITRAQSPRFGDWSSKPHLLQLSITTGRIRVFSAGEAARDVKIEVLSAPGVSTLIAARGVNASVDATPSQTTVTVREGEASVTAQEQTLVLSKDQRADVSRPDEPPQRNQSLERNLIRDGDFRSPLGTSWQTDIRQPALATEQAGAVTVTAVGGRRAVNLARVGDNWGRVGLTQDLNQDVRDFKTLKLQLDVFLAYQSIGNCGVQGTECPTMVRLTYSDANGIEREWLQGFFYRVDPNPPPIAGLNFCAPCVPRYDDHIRYEQNQWQTYESGNLLDIFRAHNLPATVLKHIDLYGSGHTFDSDVAQVQLLASD